MMSGYRDLLAVKTEERVEVLIPYAGPSPITMLNGSYLPGNENTVGFIMAHDTHFSALQKNAPPKYIVSSTYSSRRNKMKIRTPVAFSTK